MLNFIIWSFFSCFLSDNDMVIYIYIYMSQINCASDFTLHKKSYCFTFTIYLKIAYFLITVFLLKNVVYSCVFFCVLCYFKGDHQNIFFRSYCSRRIRRIRKSLHFPQGGRNRVTPKKVTVELLTDSRLEYFPFLFF